VVTGYDDAGLYRVSTKVRVEYNTKGSRILFSRGVADEDRGAYPHPIKLEADVPAPWRLRRLKFTGERVYQVFKGTKGGDPVTRIFTQNNHLGTLADIL